MLACGAPALAQDAGAPDDAAVTAPPQPTPQPAPPPAPQPAPQPVIEPAPAPVTPPPPEAPPGEATIHVQRPTPRGVSDVTIQRGALAQVPVSNASDVLRLAPGIFLTNGLGEGHAEQVFLRGFDARSGQDLEFTANGVPVNEPAHPHGQGYADTHFIIPELVESVRVLEGPFDPRQADFAVAGSANYTLRMPVRGAVLQYRYGSFNTHRVVGLWGPEGESAGTFGGVELAQSDGYGQNRASQRMSANAQYEGHVGATLTWRVLATTYVTRYRAAGVIREDDWRAGRVGFYDTYDNTQGGEVSRHTVSAEIESNRESSSLRAMAWASLRDFRLRENFTGFLLDVQRPWQSPHAQRGDGIDQSASSVDAGARASGRFRATIGGLAQSVELGAFARYNRVDSGQTRLRSSTDVPYRTDYDLLSGVTNVAAYLDAELKPWRWMTLRGGVRADMFQYDVLDRCAVHDTSVRGAPLDASCLSADRAGYREPATRRTAGGIALQPRAAMLLGPWRNVTVALSAGVGARSADPVYLGNDQAAPFSAITALEGGAVYDRRGDGWSLNARALYYFTHVGQDLVFDETQGRNALASGTTRQGALAAARFTHRRFDVAAHVTWARATYDDTGLLVPYVPELVARLDASVQQPLPWRIRDRAVVVSAGVGVTYVAPRPLPYNERADAIFTTDAQVSARWTYVELGLIAQNLFDAQYAWGQYNFVSDFHSRDYPTLVASRMFSAGPPRSLTLSLTLYLGRAASRHGAPAATEAP